MRFALAMLTLLASTMPALALQCQYESVAGDKAVMRNGDGVWELEIAWADYHAGSQNIPVAPETCPLTTAGTGMTQDYANCPTLGGQPVGFRAFPKQKLPEIMAFYGLVWFGTCRAK